MKQCGPIGLFLIATLCVVCAIPPRTTTTSTTRSTTSIGIPTKKLNQHETSSDTEDVVLDIRTPPKVKQQVQDKMKLKDEMENSHAGVAIPVDEDAIEIEEATKKLNFYKIERPTTDSGLSTWILLSGQASTTTKLPSRKPVIKPTSDGKVTQVAPTSSEKPTRIVKPIFKRSTTTHKPTSATESSTTTSSKDTTKLTKVKASVLNNLNKKFNATVDTTTRKSVNMNPATTQSTISSTHVIVKKNMTAENATMSAVISSNLPIEAKNGEADLPDSENKKKKTTVKRKKNKNKRRKPEDKDTNSTSVAKPTKLPKEKPIGTQLYNYLAREIMPTVGVGLVGLMVTAGLASYFLYPFGVARRSYEIDRKDKEGSYYYNDEYSGGMPEEEAIGKVIAGMPANTLFANSYKTPSRNTYVNTKYRLADRRAEIQKNSYGSIVQGTVENVPITSMKQEEDIYNTNQNYPNTNYDPITYTSDIDTRYSPSTDSKFVVGNTPKDTIAEATPAAVPEHGPRNLNFENNFANEPAFIVEYPPKKSTREGTLSSYPAKRSRILRRKRSNIPDDLDNEIIPTQEREVTTSVINEETTYQDVTTLKPSQVSSSDTTQKVEITTLRTQTTTNLPDRVNSFIDVMKELIHYKAKLGLQLIQNATQTISKYISKIQTRLDQHYREYSKNNH